MKRSISLFGDCAIYGIGRTGMEFFRNIQVILSEALARAFAWIIEYRCEPWRHA